MASQRLVLFIDAQNFYNDAREAFFSDNESHVYGQFHPIKLGEVICSQSPPNVTTELQQVRIYTGRPDATKQPTSYGANMRQCTYRERLGAKVVPHMLRYPEDYPREKPEQKGMDVALAVDFIAMAYDNEYDIGVITSTDTDLKPALDFVYKKYHSKGFGQKVEVATWTSSNYRKRIYIPNVNIWCHWLDRDDYNKVADLTNYVT